MGTKEENKTPCVPTIIEAVSRYFIHPTHLYQSTIIHVQYSRELKRNLQISYIQQIHVRGVVYI